MNRRNRCATTVALSLLVAAGTRAQQPPELTTGLPPGSEAVGFRREWLLDPSRVWDRSEHLGTPGGEIRRPLRVDIWYPAAATPGCQRTTVHDYLYASAPDPYFAAANRFVESWDESSYRGYAKGTNSSFDAMMALRTSACPGAVVSPGRHPLIIYSGGWYNRSPDNVALGEYLASHGYVVAEVPLFGAGLWTGDLSSNPIAIETQVRDLETVIGELSRHEWVDRTRIASMGYSSGGIVALLLESRNPLVDAVVGLDPSYGSDPGEVTSSPYFSMYRNRKPLLTLRSGNAVFTGRPRSAIIDSMHLADRYTADVGRGSHGDFSDDVVIEGALSLVRTGEPRTASEGIAAYRAVVVAVRQFLDGTLGGRTAALDSLARPGAGSVLRMTRTTGAAIPSSAEWIARLDRESADVVSIRAGDLATRNPGVIIVNERELNTAGYRRLADGRTAAAVGILRFNQLTHPNSANTYDSLADACQAAADAACTRDAYRGLLRVLPADTTIPGDVKERMRSNAEDRLKALAGAPPAGGEFR